MRRAWNRASLRRGAALIAAVLVAALGAAPASAEAGYETIVPAASPGYRYQVVNQGEEPGFEVPDFDASGFADGTAPFATAGECVEVPGTLWPAQTDLLLRRWVTIPDDGRQLHLAMRVIGGVQVFINGTEVTDWLVPEVDVCPGYDNVHVIVPEAGLLRGSDNLIAIRTRAKPASSYFDLQALLVPVPSNDDVANATEVGALPFVDTLSLLSASLEDGEPTDVCASGPDGCTTVWYSITPSTTESLVIDAGIPSTDETMPLGFAVFTGQPFGGLTQLALRQTWDWRPILLQPEPGTTYLVQVAGQERLPWTGGAAVVSILEAPPIAVSFEASPDSAVTTATNVSFWGYHHDPAQQPVASYDWDFGDGTSGTGESTHHYFKTPGTFEITLTTTMEDGRTGTASDMITVTQFMGLDPNAAFTWYPEAPDNYTDVSFQSTSSDPSLVGIERWTWTFGDGETGSGEYATHRFATAGDYLVGLEVETFDGRTATTSETVTVSEKVLQNPQAGFGFWPEQPFALQQVTFQDQSSDPEYFSIASWEWDFGDGATDTGGWVSHAFAEPDTYTVTLTITTADGRTDSESRDVTVTPPPPPEVYIWMSPYDPTTFDTVQFSANAWDPAGGSIESYAWTFGDGATSSDPYPTHRYEADGTYHVTLAVRTPDGRENSTAQDLVVSSHDVAIVKLTAAKSANSGQTKAITADITSRRSTEQVTVQLYRGTPQGFTFVAEQQVTIKVGKTARVAFDYLFTAEDASIGRVTFKVTATINAFRDALPTDNEAVTSPTKVAK